MDLLKQFMGTHHAEPAAAHVNVARALEEWESFKEHVVRTFAKTPLSRMWEALTSEWEHVQWVNVWRVLALLRTYCPAEAAVERAISLRGRFTNSLHDMEDTHVLSMCMALHCNLPPLRQWVKGQGVEVASKLAANARFDVRPGIGFRIALIHVHEWKRPCCSAWRGRLQWQTMVTFCHLLGGRRCHWLVKAQHADALTDKPRLSTVRALWSNQMVVLLSMVATMTSSLSEGAWTVQCAGSLCASGATHVWFATRALSGIQDRVVRQWCKLWMMQPRLLKITVKRRQWHHGSPTQSVPWPVHRPSWYVLQRQAYCVTGHALASVIAWQAWV